MRCLLELGDVEAVCPQAQSFLQSHSDFDAEAALLPFAIEASWQLAKWSDLDEMLTRLGGPNKDEMSSELCPEDSFRIHLGSLLSAIHKNDKSHLSERLTLARDFIGPFLSAASLESYSRAYPYLVKLHLLHDLERSFDVVNSGQPFSELIENDYADERAKMLASSTKHRSLPENIQRAILNMIKSPQAFSMLAQSWLEESRKCKENVDAARFALGNARLFGLDAGTLLIEECRILKETGQSYAALHLLEPSEIDGPSIEILSERGMRPYFVRKRLFKMDSD